MSKILFIYESDMPTVSITRNVFTQLDNYPEISIQFLYLVNVSSTDINNNDIIIFIRPEDVYSWNIAKCAKEAGHLVLIFCDDDLLNLPSIIPRIPWRKIGLINALKNADGIWSSSQYILNKYKNLTANKRIVCILR